MSTPSDVHLYTYLLKSVHFIKKGSTFTQYGVWDDSVCSGAWLSRLEVVVCIRGVGVSAGEQVQSSERRTMEQTALPYKWL